MHHPPLPIAARQQPLRSAALLKKSHPVCCTAAEAASPQQQQQQQSAPAAAATLAPKWVSTINSALEKGAAAYVFTYLLCDMGMALILLVFFFLLQVPVSAEFALAFAVSKAPPLRGPRMALDTAAAAALTRVVPSLAAVRVSLLADALARFMSLDEICKRLGLDTSSSLSDQASATNDGSEAPRTLTRRERGKQRLARASAEARRVMDEYGLVCAHPFFPRCSDPSSLLSSHISL